MKFWALKICLVCFASSFALAEDIVYSKDETITGYKYYYEQDKVTINNGVKITYNSSADNRGYFTNNGIIAKGEGNSVFSNTANATFINNGTMTIGQFNNRGTAYFYGDATAMCAYGCNGFGNRGSGTFYIIGATLMGDMEHDDIYNWKGEATIKATNTLNFGICDLANSAKCGAKMGQLNGNFTNKGTSSAINVNIANMVYGTHYTIITGTISGIDTIGFLGANLDEVTTHYDIAKGEVWIEKKSTQPDKPDPNPDPDKPNPDNPTPPPPTA